MTDERAPGATFALGDICFIDTETRGRADLKAVGAYEYATTADAIVLAYAIGDGPAQTVSIRIVGETLSWPDLPDELHAFHARVLRGEARYAAWNAGFDRAVWNYATSDFPEMSPGMIIDMMAQGAAAGLPPDLAKAAVACGAARKLVTGRDLIKLFCLPASVATLHTHPERWQAFRDYACGDVEALRGVFLRTRQLPIAEWREYWAMEAVNQRGVMVDRKMIAHAATLAVQDKTRANRELRALTDAVVTTVDQTERMRRWLRASLPPDGVALLVRREEETDEDGVVSKPATYTLRRDRLVKLIAYVTAQGPAIDSAVLRVLQIRLYGGSKTPAKFARMATMMDPDGILRGQYVFNGAGQTGRASSRGCQVHNLARDTLPYEAQAIDALLAGVSYDTMAALGDGAPVSRKLSLLIRPAFVAPPGKLLVWSDWSQIEARILPWLAGDDAGALSRLRIFRDVDADPSNPDLYTRSAATLSKVPVEAVTKPMRQRGKVAELALGFGGGLGALQAMGAGYGLHVDDKEGRDIVEAWRKANDWCVKFWGVHKPGDKSYGLWGAANRALEKPRQTFAVGRVAYTYLPGYLNGSLICTLPSGRCLTYRAIRYERLEDFDDDDQPTGKWSTHLRFARGYGRVKLWHGMLCENIVQATAADCLRGTLVRLHEYGMHVALHSHDEVMVECAERDAEETVAFLSESMRQGFKWSAGLPLTSEETIAAYYSKHPDVYYSVADPRCNRAG